MAFFRKRPNLAQAFKDDQQFVLIDVTPTGEVLGTGSYSSVEEEIQLQVSEVQKVWPEIMLVFTHIFSYNNIVVGCSYTVIQCTPDKCILSTHLSRWHDRSLKYSTV